MPEFLFHESQPPLPALAPASYHHRQSHWQAGCLSDYLPPLQYAPAAATPGGDASRSTASTWRFCIPLLRTRLPKYLSATSLSLRTLSVSSRRSPSFLTVCSSSTRRLSAGMRSTLRTDVEM